MMIDSTDTANRSPWLLHDKVPVDDRPEFFEMIAGSRAASAAPWQAGRRGEAILSRSRGSKPLGSC